MRVGRAAAAAGERRQSEEPGSEVVRKVSERRTWEKKTAIMRRMQTLTAWGLGRGLPALPSSVRAHSTGTEDSATVSGRSTSALRGSDETVPAAAVLQGEGTLEDEADLALVVEKRPAERNPDPEDPNDWEYLSSSVLLLDLAYANARVLGPVESTWLTPRSALGLAEQRDQTVDALSRLAAQHEAQQRPAAELSAKVDRVLHLLADDLDEVAPPPPQVALPRASV
eukprot:m51a1_g11627 hypothetical protein (226) ;mRNA; r:646-1499